MTRLKTSHCQSSIDAYCIAAALLALNGCAAAMPPVDALGGVDTAASTDADAGAMPDADATVHLDALADLPAIADAATHDHGRVGGHGMLLTGAGAHLYLSHLPAFYEPHRVQVIVEGRFPSPPASLPTDFSTELHSFSPEPLSLDALREGALTELRGTVYRGNYEQGGSTLASGVVFALTRVVYQNELGTPADAQQGYLVFGQPDALFAAHRITTEPGFDHLLRVTVDPPLPSGELASGAVLLRRAIDDVVANRIQTSAAFTDTTGAAHSLAPSGSLSCLLGPGFATVCP